MQTHLNEFFAACEATGPPAAPTASAWSQARIKLRHTAFIELSQECVLEPFYRLTEGLTRWCGRRLLAVDGSLVRLPSTEPLGERFGWVVTSNQHGDCGLRYPQARVSVLYDVLNRMGLDATLAPYEQGEITLAQGHLKAIGPSDVVVSDRGYCGLLWLMAQHVRGVDFIVRCPRGWVAEAQALFEQGQGGVSRIVRLEAHGETCQQLQARGWPLSLTVRLVTVALPNGELEVLVSSLLDDLLYPTALFAEAYDRRWGMETFYGRLKGRLELENWSGQSEESVQQDFHASVMISNLESVLVREAQAELTAGDGQRQYPQVINHAVSFHTIKSEVFGLLEGTWPLEEVLDRLRRLFLGQPVSVRKDRKVKRAAVSVRRSLHYQRNMKKVAF